MNTIKALMLCNNAIALPTIKEFLFYGHVAAIAIPKRNKEMQFLLQNLLAETSIPLILIDKKNYEEQLLDIIKIHQPTIGIITTFPFILSAQILNAVPKGIVNMHFGLLPQCRGPQPILNHMLLNNTHAGVTLHVLDEGIDTGNIISQEKLLIEPQDTYGILQSKLAFLAAKLAANLVKILSYGSIIPATPQNHSLANYYKMPTAAQLTINWQTQTADEILRLVNACNPWNKGAGTSIGQWVIGITEVEIIDYNTSSNEKPGTIITINNQQGLLVKTFDDKAIKINIVYITEGFFSGYLMQNFGLKIGDTFN